jgi:hypothetical protein
MALPESLPQALDRVYQALAAQTDVGNTGDQGGMAPPPGSPAAATEPWLTLAQLTELFALTSFERDMLVLLTGHVLEARFAKACGAALGTTATAPATFGLALAALEDPHWSALSPARPLRYWQLVSADPGDLLHSPVRLDERVLAHLLGMPALDERLGPFVRPLRLASPAAPEDDLQPDSDAVLTGARHWSGPEAATLPLLLISAAQPARDRAFTAICAKCGLLPYGLDAADIPTAPADREALARLWSREAALSGSALHVRTSHGRSDDGRTETLDAGRHVAGFVACLQSRVAIGVMPGGADDRLDGVRLPLRGGMTRQERREHARRGLSALATRVEPASGWHDLVLPDAQVGTLRQVVLHVRHKALVNGEWGFAARHPRGLGLTALFAGPSGTGKTMAAEVIAADLGLDLYRIDLATVVSKYIGETEKNLREIFTAAADTDAILLFDEADALFGKRSEVRDSHDRYANLEISYLLQQMEAYRGAAILTTNMQHALDPAFLRRIRFIMQFPFPDATARARIWQRIFPVETPLGDLDWGRLAQLNVAGGVIRNIATLAAFLAADDGGRVEARHVLAAVRTEYAKLDKPLTAAETRGLM